MGVARRSRAIRRGPTLPDGLRDFVRGRGAGLIDLGLLALMATPIARVAILAL